MSLEEKDAEGTKEGMSLERISLNSWLAKRNNIIHVRSVYSKLQVFRKLGDPSYRHLFNISTYFQFIWLTTSLN